MLVNHLQLGFEVRCQIQLRMCIIIMMFFTSFAFFIFFHGYSMNFPPKIAWISYNNHSFLWMHLHSILTNQLAAMLESNSHCLSCCFPFNAAYWFCLYFMCFLELSVKQIPEKQNFHTLRFRLKVSKAKRVHSSE